MLRTDIEHARERCQQIMADAWAIKHRAALIGSHAPHRAALDAAGHLDGLLCLDDVVMLRLEEAAAALTAAKEAMRKIDALTRSHRTARKSA